MTWSDLYNARRITAMITKGLGKRYKTVVNSSKCSLYSNTRNQLDRWIHFQAEALVSLQTQRTSRLINNSRLCKKIATELVESCLWGPEGQALIQRSISSVIPAVNVVCAQHWITWSVSMKSMSACPTPSCPSAIFLAEHPSHWPDSSRGSNA